MPNPLHSLSRRAALTLLGGAGATVALPTVGRAALRVEDLSPSWFRDHVGEHFRLSPSDGRSEGSIEVVLEEVAERERTGRRVAPFTLLFRESGRETKSDACFTISHSGFEVPGVFVSRVLGKGDGQRHEVIFG